MYTMPVPKFFQNDPIFSKIDLSVSEQTYVRGKPREYLLYTARLLATHTDAKVIVEVGSIRQPMNHTILESNPVCCNDGHSTYFWKEYTSADIYTVDINPNSKRIIENDSRLNGVHAITSDAYAFLKSFDKKIDLLFLDAWDVIDGTEYAEAHLDAYLICKDKLSRRCLILIDDTDIGNKGKGRAVIPKLFEDGFQLITEGRQTLLIRE
jgi:hypothetical protein